MRNPLSYSAGLFIKKAAPNAPFNIPAYQAPAAAQPMLNPEQIQQLMTNIQSYPVDQQQAILDTINQNFGQSKYQGGFFGNVLGGLGNWAGSAWNQMQSGMNRASDALFGVQPFDAQDSDRYRAETVLQTAAQNPEMYQNVMKGLQNIGVVPQTPATPAASPVTQTPVAPTAVPTPAPTPTPTPAPAPAAPAATPAPAQTAQPVSGVPGSTDIMQQIQQANGNQGISAFQPPSPAPAPAPAAPAPDPTPWTNPNAKFNPSWTPAQKEQFIRAKYPSQAPAQTQTAPATATAKNPYTGQPYGAQPQARGGLINPAASRYAGNANISVQAPSISAAPKVAPAPLSPNAVKDFQRSDAKRWQQMPLDVIEQNLR